MSDSDKKYKYDLLRYPVITVCIVFGLGMLKLLIGFDLSQVTEITKDGIKLGYDTASVKVSQNLDLRIRTLEGQINGLDLDMDSLVLSLNNNVVKTSAKTKTAFFQRSRINRSSFGTTEIADANAAKLSFTDKEENSTMLKDKIGWVWLVSTDSISNNSWTLQLNSNAIVRENNNYKLNLADKNTSFVIKNVALRDSTPKSSANDNSESKTIGVIPEGIKVEIIELRQEDKELWLKVKVLE